MKIQRPHLILSLLPVVLAIGVSCSKKAVEDAIDEGDGGGASLDGTITEAKLAGTWTGTCTATSDPISGADHVLTTYTLTADGNYIYTETWYTGACSPVNYAIIYESSGTYSVGALLNGSNDTQSISFVAASGDLMAMSQTAQTGVNTDCGGTSPFIGGVNNSFNGTHHSTYGALSCANVAFPNSGLKTIENVVKLNGSTMTVGATDHVVPGILVGAAPTVASTEYTK